MDLGRHALLAGVLGDAVERMDAHVEDVASAVLEADGLLLLAADVHLLQATELADAVVDVHHEVARLEAHELLDGQGLLVLLEAILQAEAVVPLENLVVGVDGQLDSLVHEALAEFGGNRLVLHLVATVGEDVVQALELGALARHHERGKPVLMPMLQMLGQQVEVLVEPGLVLLAEVHRDAVREAGAPAELHHAVGLEPALEPQARRVQLSRAERLGQAGPLLVEHLGLFDLLVQLIHHPAHIPRPDAALLAEELEEGLTGLLDELVLHVRHDDRPVHLAHAQLVGRIELPDAVHLIPEQLNAIGVVEGIAEDVDDASPDGVFAGLIDVFHLLEPVVDEQLVDEILGNAVAPLNGVGVALQLLPRGDLLGDRFRETDHAHLAAQGLEFVHHLGAHGDVGIVSALLLIGNPCAAGIEEDLMSPFTEESLEVVHEVGRALLVLEKEQVVPTVAPHGLRREEGPGRSDQSARLHLGLRDIQRLHDAARPGVMVIEGEEVLQRHGAREDNRPHPLGFGFVLHAFGTPFQLNRTGYMLLTLH